MRHVEGVPMRQRLENENEINRNKVQSVGIRDFSHKFHSNSVSILTITLYLIPTLILHQLSVILP